MSVNRAQGRPTAPIDVLFVVGITVVCFALWTADKELTLSLVFVVGAIVVTIALAWIAFQVAVALWLAVFGYIVAGWLGAFIGFCAMLILNAVRARNTSEDPRPIHQRQEEPYKPGFPL